MRNILLIASQTGHQQGRTRNVVSRMREVCDQVVNRGYQVKFLGPTPRSVASDKAQRIFGAFSEARPESTIAVAVYNYVDSYFLRWPKDCIQSYRPFVALSEAHVAKRIAGALGLVRTKTSLLCEGGLVLKAGDSLVFSSAVKRCTDLDLLKRQYSVLFVPHPYTSSRYCGIRPKNPLGESHVDLDCNLVMTKDGTPLFLVGAAYYAAYRRTMRSVARSIKAVIFVMPRKEAARRAANLVALGPGDAIIPSRNPSTRAFLTEYLGSDHVIEVQIHRDFAYNGGVGGLGCMTSLIEAKHCV